MLAAVRQNGLALKFASDELKSDREIVMVAVGSCWRALEFAGCKFKFDREIAFTAMLQDSGALQYVDKSLRCDERLLHEVSQWAAAAKRTAADTRFTLDPSWDAATAAKYVSEKFTASGKLGFIHDASAPTLLRPLVGYRISSIELLSNATCAAATSALSRMWGLRQTESTPSSEQRAVRRVFGELLRESGE